MRFRFRSFLLTAFFISIAVAAWAQTPGAPTNLTATINADNTLTLQWSPPQTGGAPTGYLVQLGTSAGATDVLNQQIGNVTSYHIDSLPAGTYYVRIRALNASGVSAASNELTL